MEDEFLSDDYEEDEASCRSCHCKGNPELEFVTCDICRQLAESGKVKYNCLGCGHTWKVGKWELVKWGESTVCLPCSSRKAGECISCNSAVTPKQSSSAYGNIMCNACLNKSVPVWCPICEEFREYFGYLKIVFFDNPAELQAAALVTHYRHEHIISHDKAWRNPHYAMRIPGYVYDEYKEKANNRAKRQLIRSFAKRIRAGTCPAEMVPDARDVILAFDELQDTDLKTTELIQRVLAKLNGSK